MKLVILYILLLSSPIFGTAYADEAVADEGLRTYAVSTRYNGSDVFVFLVTELANLSIANEWEVSISVSTNDTLFKLQIYDSHQAMDQDDDTVIREEDEAGHGRRTYGPWRVYASSNLTYGSLVWMIHMTNFYKNITILEFAMVWGWADKGPFRIGDDLTITVPPSVNPLATLFTGILVLVAGYRAYSKSTMHTIAPKD